MDSMTKVVYCAGNCGTQLIVSKFASEKLSQCRECKCNYGSTGNRKRPDKAVKGTKRWAMERFDHMYTLNLVLDGAIMKAIDDKKIKSGFCLVHGSAHQYSINWYLGLLDDDKQSKMYGPGKKKAKLWDYQYHTGRLKSNIEEAFDGLVEAGADIQWHQWIAGKCHTTEAGLEHWARDAHEAKTDEEIQSAIDNLADEWNDHQTKYGWK